MAITSSVAILLAMDDGKLRRDWLFPAGDGFVADMSPDLVDVSDDVDRHVLLLADHPDLAPALERGDDEIVLNGVPINPTLHLAMHDVVAQRILDGHPEQWWETSQRLTAHGYDRHEVLHMLCNVVSDEVYGHLNDAPLSDDDVLQRLAALPESWETQRPRPPLPPPPANRSERRALQRRRHGSHRR